MKKSDTLAFLRLLCMAVIAIACAGVFATGAWAFNTWITRTPVETLTYGTFTASLVDRTPDENGQYSLTPDDYELTLHAEGNIDRVVQLTVTPQGNAAPAPAVYYAVPGDTPFTVHTDYPLTLTLDVQEVQDMPEEPQWLTENIELSYKLPVADEQPAETPATEPTTDTTQPADTTPATDTPAAPATDEPVTTPSDITGTTGTTDTADETPTPAPAESTDEVNSGAESTDTNTAPTDETQTDAQSVDAETEAE